MFIGGSFHGMDLRFGRSEQRLLTVVFWIVITMALSAIALANFALLSWVL